MPSFSRVRSPETGIVILIAAPSGRALAAAARRAGYRPFLADFFDDSDTRGFCAANRLIAGGLDTGFEGESLIGALTELAKEATPCGFVYGAGFEDRAELLELVAQRWTLFGNSPGVVRSVKDPVRLAELCATLNIPHPKISARIPRDGRHWLVKSAGGSGGSHVAPAGALRAEGEKIYFQRIAAGEPVSILFLGDGAKARMVGSSRQWAAPAPGEPFRFGGCLRPAGLSPGLETRLRRAAEAITAACGLRGLNSIDFLVEGSEYTLLEVNPRPGATLDIFEDRDGSLVPGPYGVLPRPPATAPARILRRRGRGNSLRARGDFLYARNRLAKLDVGPAESAERVAAVRPVVHDQGPRGKAPARPRTRRCADQFNSRQT